MWPGETASGGDKPFPPLVDRAPSPHRQSGGKPRRGPRSGALARTPRIPARFAGYTTILLRPPGPGAGQTASLQGPLVLKVLINNALINNVLGSKVLINKVLTT